ncbi:hypothetical protein Godav_013217, partial [Gossypium davidsonii]|nr:hypothetical protein [Gossypium davidsonii]
MLMIYLNLVRADTQIHNDSPIIDRNSPFYDDINGAGPMYAEGGEPVAKSDAKSTILNLGNVFLGKMITLTKMENVGITALLYHFNSDFN